MSSPNRIDKSRYDRVMFSRVCPGCNNYVIIDVVKRSKKDVLDQRSGSKYLGSYHCCGGPDGHECWHMSKYDVNKPEKHMYETFGQFAKMHRVAAG